ncbi:MAG TPA: hypothetical protein PLA90_00310 [Candidatus Sumerlaeota bacterium]|nr:hypothetical protein [Candidatus Sumerlaeota bacterium]
MRIVGTGLITILLLMVLGRIFLNNCDLVKRTPESIARSDLHSLAVALESYEIENNCYPVVTTENRYPLSARLRCLTTPVAYLSELPRDPFMDQRDTILDTYYYDLVTPDNWRLISAGPDQIFEYGEVIYDGTNGTNSRGDVVLTSDDKKK